MDHLLKSCNNLKDSRGQGFEDSSERLKNYKELKIWQRWKGCSRHLLSHWKINT
jgi:hypothetical protein